MSKNVKQTENLDGSKRIRLSSAALFHNFDENPQFVGRFLGEHIGQVEDTETHIKHEGVIGYDFVNDDGEEVIISKSYAIAKALTTPISEGSEKLFKDVSGIFDISFMGKVTNSKGKPFNRFDVGFTPDK
jgi:hypothetical protein